MANTWFTYIVQCADDSLYTGVTTDIQRRLTEHNNGKLGAKYTRTRRPVKLVYHAILCSRSEACKLEHQIKQLSRAEKLALIAT
ncbi:GIY-YIG nuclease family protein [Thalassotalea ganghwensis]